ncbi:MAG: cytochrome c family protein [Candidatus Omnitrophica bacterium]|nr:cytochrome c family protein [Candidatus Omnitrophota bacterium]
MRRKTGFLVLFLILSTLIFAQEQSTYVGVDKCMLCHPQESQDYKARKFAKSWQVLQMREKTKDPECLKCHTTGFGEPSGFVSEEQTPHLKYKQCEACHGPGSLHANNPGDLKLREEIKKYAERPDTCTKCHKGVIAHRVGVKGF